MAAKISDGDTVTVALEGQKIEKRFVVDPNLKGTIALMPIFDLDFEGQRLMTSYRFKKVKIKQVEQ
ncbi:hypothetical protein D1872_264260 [compost metagenome]